MPQEGDACPDSCSCVRCQWRRYGKAWRRHFDWVACRDKDGKFGIGCRACFRDRAGKATTRCNFALFKVQTVTTQHLERHAHSRQHIQAAKQDQDQDDAQAGLSVADFQKCWEAMQQGRSARSLQGPKGSASDRTSLMRWCIAESILDSARAFLHKAVTVVLIRDERNGRLLCRWRASTPDLQARAGVMGVCKALPGSDAEAINEATGRIINRFCTTFCGAPRATRLPAPVLDTALERHIRDRIEIVVTDAAANELLAGNQGRGRRGACGQPELTPNLMLVARDHAHASRRTPNVMLLTMSGC